MIIGIVIAILTMMMLEMIFTKRCKNKIFQKWNHKVHKITGISIFILSLLHFIMVWRLRQQRPTAMYVLGIAMLLLITILIMSYYLRVRIGRRWIVIHRIATCGLLVCLAGHIYFGVNSLQSYQKQVGQISVNQIDLNILVTKM